MNRTEQTVTRALAALGNTPDAVAAALIRGSWTGTRHDGCACPVANYLMAVVPDARLAAVGFAEIGVLTYTHGYAFTPVPGPIAEFLDAFDGGAYPALADGDVHER